MNSAQIGSGGLVVRSLIDCWKKTAKSGWDGADIHGITGKIRMVEGRFVKNNKNNEKKE